MDGAEKTQGVATEDLGSNHEYQRFVESVSIGDGRLIKLKGKTSRLGEIYYISVRFGKDPIEDNSDRKYLNVDIFVDRKDDFFPVGIRDYEITGDTADGNKQRHGHLPINKADFQAAQAQTTADRYWATGEGLHVRGDTWISLVKSIDDMERLRERGFVTSLNQWNEPIYQKHGLGTLMIAVSILVLQRHGVKKIKLGSYTEVAKKTWARFGVNEDVSEVSVAQLAENPAIKKAIIPFLVK